MKLTAAQHAALRRAADNADYGTGFAGGSHRVKTATMMALVARGLVAIVKTSTSGRYHTYRITDAGREAVRS